MNSSLNKAIQDLITRIGSTKVGKNLYLSDYAEIANECRSWSKDWIEIHGQECQVTAEALNHSKGDKSYREYMERSLAMKSTEAILEHSGTCSWTKDNKPAWEPNNNGYGWGERLRVEMYVLRREKKQ